MNPIIRRRNSGRLERQTSRHLREDEAGRLLDKVPALTSLSIAMQEAPADNRANDTRYTRRVVLEHASSLFEVRCSDAHCDEGVYDLTRHLVAALAAGSTHVEGECACSGTRPTGPCDRVLRYVATATYLAQPEARPAAPSAPSPSPSAFSPHPIERARGRVPEPAPATRPVRPSRGGEKAA
jgi:hypothetical protein